MYRITTHNKLNEEMKRMKNRQSNKFPGLFCDEKKEKKMKKILWKKIVECKYRIIIYLLVCCYFLNRNSELQTPNTLPQDSYLSGLLQLHSCITKLCKQNQTTSNERKKKKKMRKKNHKLCFAQFSILNHQYNGFDSKEISFKFPLDRMQEMPEEWNRHRRNVTKI